MSVNILAIGSSNISPEFVIICVKDIVVAVAVVVVVAVASVEVTSAVVVETSVYDLVVRSNIVGVVGAIVDSEVVVVSVEVGA